MEPQSATEHDVTVGEAMRMALAFQQRGQLDDAEQVYRRVLEVAPDHPDIVHFYGVLLHQLGRSEEAIATIRAKPGARTRSRRVLQQPRHHPAGGRSLRGGGRRCTPGRPSSIRRMRTPTTTWASCAGSRGKPAEAEAAYRKAIELKPTYAEAYHNLGVLLTGQKRHREAILCYFKVLSLEPARTDDRRLLAIAYCEIGERDKAIEIFEKWIAEDPESPVARHMLAAVTGRDVPARASDAYRRTELRRLRGIVRAEARAVVVPCAVAGGGGDQGFGSRGGGGARRARRRLRHRAVRPAGQAVCAAAGRRRPVGRACSTKAQQKQVYDRLVKDELTHFLQVRHARVRSDPVGGHAGLLRAARGGRRGRQRRAASGRAVRVHARGACRRRPTVTFASRPTAATATASRTSNAFSAVPVSRPKSRMLI